MTDRQTLDVYEAQAAEYERLARGEPYPILLAFMALLPEGALVLDLGCGPGIDAGHLAAEGFEVEAMDASESMVARASARPGVAARLGSFDDLAAEDLYHGVWAAFSLLHASRADLPRHLAAIARALKPGGILGLTLKEGTGEKRDGLGRHYTYYTEEELRLLLGDAGLTVRDVTRGEGRGLDGSLSAWISVTSHA